MSYQTFIGEKQSLVFPVMGYSYLTIDYNREIADRTPDVGDANTDTTDDIPYSIFGHTDSFTISTIITPYDVNGYKYLFKEKDNPTGKNGITNSKKTMPHNQFKTISYVNGDGSSTTTSDSQHQSYSYFTDNHKTHEMMIFYNTNVQLSLVNDTSIEHNQPAEYKIRFTVVADGVSDSLTSDVVIKSDTKSNINSGSINLLNGFDGEGNFKSYEKIDKTITMASTNTFTNTPTNTAGQFFVNGEKLYTESGQVFTHAGTVTNTSGSTTSIAAGHSITSSEVLYREGPKEALYLVTPFHIGASFDAKSGKMIVFINNVKIAEQGHSSTPITDFLFTRDNSYIGAKITGTLSTDNVATNRKQFMGEIHEFAITDSFTQEFNNTSTLLPTYRNLLLYYRFEEIDL
tara:strand:- start:167 stop:1372 length:1206 start_codon:yes stop_codon:yes gene_type:complete